MNEQDFIEAAKDLACDTAAIKAVYQVETSGNAFLQDGRMKILFEGHQFWRLLRKSGFDPLKLFKGHENILYPHWDRTKYKGGSKEWDRMSEAIALCKDNNIPTWIALDSASYGAFQIMGFNSKLAGFPTAQEMITTMNNEGEPGQLKAFVNYLKNSGLADELKNHNWPLFAESYNGPGYKGNPLTSSDDYDLRLQKAYTKINA